ncbi:hypothetical protein [Marinilactibacillus kalidii]|uniref:hypothetical protein n=1 Tax=Marinilactibacillus kalidii TaxID=2820274 RepID=UPI001ABDD5CF|nr:hypothetical protein [Marinilactibacillus kalidii]
MKKYSKLLTFLTLSIIVLGFHGISMAFAESENRVLEFKTLEGDDVYLDDLIIRGFATGSTEIFDPSFSYRDRTFTYAKDQSLFKRLDEVEDPQINRIRERYRSFVRGKSSRGYFKETDDVIVYANSSNAVFPSYKDQTLDISVLNKADDSISDYTLELPIEESQVASLENVYINYPNVYFTVHSSMTLSVFSTNLNDATPSLSLEENLTDSIGTNIGLTYSYMYAESPNQRFLTIGKLENADTDLDSSDMVFNSSDIKPSHIYDYQTGKIIDLDLSTNDSLFIDVIVEDDLLFLMSEFEKTFTLQEIDTDGGLSEPTEITKETLPTLDNPSINNSDFSVIGIKDGRLYSRISAYPHGSTNSAIQVNDLESGELLYFGMIVPESLDVWVSTIYLND